jgi:hypothetical protein
MPLIDIRIQFIQYTGRYDLVLDTLDYDDNGSDVFIVAGQRWLDRTFEVNGSIGRDDSLLDIGNWYSLIPEVRVIEEVWVSLTTGERYPLTYLPFKDYRTAFPQDLGTFTPGRISYYTPVFFTKIPASSDVLVDVVGLNQYIVANPASYNGLIFTPPTDAIVNLEVHGKFYQPKLVNNSDTNLWSEAYPTALVLAACRQVEISYRNQAGVRDYETALEGELRGAEYDLVDSETNNMPRLKG